MKLAGIDFNLNHKAVEVYISGCCVPHCEGCHNEELWSFERGHNPFGSLMSLIIQKGNLPITKRVWIMGGEPLDQDLERLWRFIAMIKHFSPPDFEIWLWTRYTHIPEKISKYITHAKVGSYQKNLDPYTDTEYGVTLASLNQRIIKIGVDK